MDIEEMGRGVVDWINLARDDWRDDLNTIMNPWVP